MWRNVNENSGYGCELSWINGVENNLYLSNPELKVFGLSMLELVKAIEEKKEKIIYPLSMKILTSIITKLPKRVLTYILMKQANWDRK